MGTKINLNRKCKYVLQCIHTTQGLFMHGLLEGLIDDALLEGFNDCTLGGQSPSDWTLREPQ